MCWGFPGDGWFDLLDRASAKLEALIQALPEQDRPRASQVKQKWGGLRLYMTWSTDEMDAVIQEAEAEADRTCERCGQPGVLRQGGWIVTVCDECDKRRD
jgi:hypothetical protein